MRVEMYSPGRMYGFVVAGSERVFFHLESFVAGTWPSAPRPPPPIIGEAVRVDYTATTEEGGQAPRAERVVRIHPPVELCGVVESFNPDKGWGWATGDADTESCYLHRSEVEDGRLPLPGQEVWFYKGQKNGRPRACHVRVGKLRG